jgi:hypothetical protein
VRIVIVLALRFILTPQHLDVKTAFLNRKLKHEIYVKLPPGVTIGGKTYGLALKSIYGLKQAAHDWHALQHAFIMGFDKRLRRSDVDSCLYILIDGDLIVLISTHVDDYVVACNNDAWYQSFLAAFSRRFEVNDLGVLDHLLQMSVTWAPDKSWVSLSQERYIAEVAEKYGLTDCKPIQTPMDKSIDLSPVEEVDHSLPFRALIGCLLWIARASRPDIMFCVIYLSKFTNSYNKTHFIAAKRILRYLVSTSHLHLTFHQQPKAELLTLLSYSDSDWVSDKNDRKSVSGSVVYLNNYAVGWSCKRQVTVALIH